MSKLILDESEVRKAIKMYVEEKYNIWRPDTMIESITLEDFCIVDIPKIVVTYDLDKTEEDEEK